MFIFTMIVTKYLLIYIASKMKRLYSYISAIKSTLQKTPKVFQSISMHSAVHVFFHVIYNFMDVLLCKSIVHNCLIGIYASTVMNVFQNLNLQSFPLGIAYYSGANLAGL